MATRSIRHAVIAVGVALSAALVLAACGGGTPSAAPGRTSSKRVDCSDSSLSQSDWVKYCGAKASPSPAIATAKVGTPFRYRQVFSDSSKPNDWQVTVTSIRCGITTIKHAASNPAYDGGNAQYVDATPAPGKQFCEVDLTAKNVGRTPGDDPLGTDTIILDMGQFSNEDDANDQDINQNLDDQDNTATLNPGDEATLRNVWSVPTNATPRGVLYPTSDWDAADGASPEYRVML